MIASMGAGGMEGMPGMGGATKSLEEMKQEIEALKAVRLRQSFLPSRKILPKNTPHLERTPPP